MYSIYKKVIIISFLLNIFFVSSSFSENTYKTNPFIISLEIPAPEDSAGGIIVADVDNDELMDYLVTVPGHLAVYGNNGTKLWILKTDIVVGSSSESHGLPGHNGPGAAR